MPDLITIDEYKQAEGIQLTDTTNDDQLSWSISAASQAVLNYTGRDFAAIPVTEERRYEYDGCGYLDIDDCTAVTQVVLSVNGVDTTLAANTWRAEPYNGQVYDLSGPIYEYIVLPSAYGYQSPEMGFTYNLDVYARENYFVLPFFMKVTANYGWPQVPADVKQAVVWTVKSMSDDPSGEVTSEAIAGYSHSFAQGQPALAIANRARDILSNYQRVHI